MLGKLLRIGPTQARESVRSITCNSNLLEDTKSKISTAWRRGVNTRTLATMHGIPRLEIEAVIHENFARKVIPFPEPRPTGPAMVQMRRAA